MSIPFENKRFRINPVEIAVFAVVGLIFVKSGYNLIYSHEGFEPAALTASAQDPIHAKERNPASFSQVSPSNFSEVKIGCDPTAVTASVTSNKIRLIGSVCKPVQPTAEQKAAAENSQAAADTNDSPSPPTHPLTPPQSQPGIAAATPEAAESVKTISVVNTSARVSATVFPDFNNERFSTDYISLAPGKNTIHVQYEFKNGDTLGQEFSVTKN